MADMEALEMLRALLASHVGKRSFGDVVAIMADPSLPFRLVPVHARRYGLQLEAFQEADGECALGAAGASAGGQGPLAGPGLLPQAAAAAIFARAAYGALMRRGGGDQVHAFIGGAAASACGRWDAAAHDDAFLELAGVARQDLLMSSWSERTFEPAFVLFWAHQFQWLVLTVRGSSELKSILTDIAADTVEVAGGQAHSGMVRAARWVLERARLPLIAALQQLPNYTVVCTGHSLGADVAAIVALLLRTEAYGTGSPGGLELREETRTAGPPDPEPGTTAAALVAGPAVPPGPAAGAMAHAVAYAFGTSPLLSPELASRCAPFVLSVARNMDYITRLSVFGMDRLILELTEQSVARRAKQWLLAKFSGEERVSNDRAATRDRAFGNGAKVAEVLAPPGQLLHIDHRDGGTPRLLWALPGFYHEMLISPSMFHDHLPIRYVEDLLQAVHEHCAQNEEPGLQLEGRAARDPGSQRRVLARLEALAAGLPANAHAAAVPTAAAAAVAPAAAAVGPAPAAVAVASANGSTEGA